MRTRPEPYIPGHPRSRQFVLQTGFENRKPLSLAEPGDAHGCRIQAVLALFSLQVFSLELAAIEQS
jgi:hypothetical protein